MRTGTQASAASTRSGCGSVSRKFPPTEYRTSSPVRGGRLDHAHGVHAGSGRHRKAPHRLEPGAHGRVFQGQTARQRRAIRAHLGAALNATVATDRHEPGAVVADETAHQAEITQRRDRLGAVAVLREAHAPYEHHPPRGTYQIGEGLDLGPRRARALDERVEVHRVQARDPGRVALDVGVDEGTVDLTARDDQLRDGAQERHVAPGVHPEEPFGDLRAEHRGLRVRRHPVLAETRLVVGVHGEDADAVAARLEQVLQRHGLVVGRVRPEEDHGLGVHPVTIAAGARGHAERRAHRDRRRAVAEARGIVEVRAAQEPPGLLHRVVDLVGQPTRGQEERHPLRIRRPKAGAQALQRFGPGHARETALPATPHHGPTQTSQGPQRLAVLDLQCGDVRHAGGIHGIHGVEPQEIETDEAEVRALDRPVLQPRGAQRAAVADALAEDLPGVGRVLPVVPGDLQHLQVVVRLALAEPERKPHAPPQNGWSACTRRLQATLNSSSSGVMSLGERVVASESGWTAI
jgi:hypothetical protein